MRHFAFLTASERARLFHRAPQPFTRASGAPALGVGLGATLYIPGTRPEIAKDLRKQAAHGVVSAVVCLEDAVADVDVAGAERNAVAQLRDHARSCAAGDPDLDGPLVFVRVRSPQQVATIVDGLGDAHGVLAGFVLPKFTAASGPCFLAAVERAGQRIGRRLLVMPVLESPEFAYAESRVRHLLEVKAVVDDVRDAVAAVRIGATDLAGVYGLRRGRDLTVYDVRAIADVIADIVNVFGRADGSGYVVTGPVWEHFAEQERLFKPLLRESPFAGQAAGGLRASLLQRDLDGLLREYTLDKANGLLGKTVIHPSHVAAVHALSVVSHEEFCDATDILGARGGGVAASSYGNKMNESKPHAAWALRTMQRSEAFGVAGPDVSVVDLLAASLSS